MDRKGSAVWNGSLKDGGGTLTTPSGVMTGTPYSFRTRFEDGITGTNPEELIAAAHAGCFSMALSNILGEAGLIPDQINTTSTVTMVPVDGAPTITRVHVDVSAQIPGATNEAFQEAASKAEKTCPISRLFKAEITMMATLE